MAITRIAARWSGFRGAPGYSNFFFDGEFSAAGAAEAAAVAVREFFFEIQSELPQGLSIQVQSTADVIDEVTGQITSIIDFAEPTQVIGLGSSTYSAASGAVVNWNTLDYVNGRRVRGRTFIVPLATGSYDDQGDLDGTALGSLRTAADDLVTTALDHPLCVWRRPVNGAGGTSHPVSSATVPDLPAVLRSRRD